MSNPNLSTHQFEEAEWTQHVPSSCAGGKGCGDEGYICTDCEGSARRTTESLRASTPPPTLADRKVKQAWLKQRLEQNLGGG